MNIITAGTRKIAIPNFGPVVPARPIGGVAAGLAYDNIPNLVHVYEIARRTLTAYEGNLVRLRRGSDNAELDFGYDANGDLDTAAITTWLGGASGFVVTIYDQVGGDDVTMATGIRQPLFVDSGQGSRPVVRYDGINDFLQAAFIGGQLTRPYNIYVSAILDAAAVNDGSQRTLLTGDGTGEAMVLYQNPGPTPDAWSIFQGAALVGGDSDGNWNIWSVLFNGASSQFWLNGTSEAAGDAGTQPVDGITVGSLFNGSTYWAGDIGPAIVVEPSHSTAQREAMEAAINDYYSIF